MVDSFYNEEDFDAILACLEEDEIYENEFTEAVKDVSHRFISIIELYLDLLIVL